MKKTKKQNMQILLASNSSTDIYRNNTLTKFTNKLPFPLQLNENAKICLELISFDNLYSNIPTQIPSTLRHFFVIDQKQTNRTKSFGTRLPHTNISYTFLKDYFINLSPFKKFFEEKSMHVHVEKDNTMYLIIKEQHISLAILKKIAIFLGLTDLDSYQSITVQEYTYILLTHEKLVHKFTQPSLGGDRTLLIQLEELDSIITGETYPKILATIPYTPSFLKDEKILNQIFTYEPKTRNFLPLRKTNINAFSITLRNENGEQLNLRTGQPTFIKLKIKMDNDDTSFMIRLKSNDSDYLFPSNKTGHFKVQLPLDLNLEENWKVALSSLHFPSDINMSQLFRKEKYFISVQRMENAPLKQNFANQSLIPFNERYKLFRRLFANENYDDDDVETIWQLEASERYKNYTLHFQDKEIFSAEDMINEIQKFFFEHKFKIITKLNGDNFFMKIGEPVTLGFSEHFVSLLSLSPTAGASIYSITKPMESTTAFHFSGIQPHTVILYLNIINSSIIGNQYAPILKMIPFGKKVNNYRHYEAKNLEFISLKHQKISVLEFVLRDAGGNIIIFKENLPIIINLMFSKE